MAPSKVRGIALSAVRPTEAEFLEARSIISQAGGQAGGRPADKETAKKREMSCMASMVHWLKQNADELGAQAALSSRGEDRRRYLEAWMVHAAREKKARTVDPPLSCGP